MKKILVIEDNDSLRNLVEKILQSEGYNCIAVGDGTSALDMIAQKNFDLIITDLVLPQKDGLELIQIIRKQNEDIKIIAMSGNTKIDKNLYLTIAKEIGASNYIAKPFTVDKFIEIVNETIF